MVIKVYVAMISCSQEIKKNQQRAVMILESKKIPYTIIDITDPANEDSKDYMVETAVPKEGCKIPVTPQIFNEADYCGDYDAMDMANECDNLGDFLKLSEEEKKDVKIGITGIIPRNDAEETGGHITNGVSASREISPAEVISTDHEKDMNEHQPQKDATNQDDAVSSPAEAEIISGPETDGEVLIDGPNEHPQVENESSVVKDEVEGEPQADELETKEIIEMQEEEPAIEDIIETQEEETANEEMVETQGDELEQEAE